MTHHAFVRAISFILIALLATASVINIHARSVEVHSVNGWHIWNISVGFAVLFALTVYAAMIAQRTKTKMALGFIASFASVVTSAIQTTLYLNHNAGWVTALAFGLGVPAAEGLLAMVDALMLNDEQTETKRSADEGFFSRLGSAVGNKVTERIEAQPSEDEVKRVAQIEPQSEGEVWRTIKASEPKPERRNASVPNERGELILEALRNEGPLRTGELADLLGVSTNTIRAELDKMNGQIEKVGRGVEQ